MITQSNYLDILKNVNLSTVEVTQLASLVHLNKMKNLDALTNPETTRDYLIARLSMMKREHFLVLFLDNRHQVLESEIVFSGTIDGAAVYPRVIAEKALRYNSAALIIAHNHPSGIAEPSTADEAITRRIRDSLALLDIRLLDHFIVGNGRPVSLAERGIL